MEYLLILTRDFDRLPQTMTNNSDRFGLFSSLREIQM